MSGIEQDAGAAVSGAGTLQQEAPEPGSAASPGTAIAAGPAGEEEEQPDFYPPLRGQEALAKARWWLRAHVKGFSQPEAWVNLLVVSVCVVFVAWQFQLSQVFKNTTISGGDTGAHVLLPWLVIHQLLPHLRLTGWTSANWDGWPAVTFYFPLPIYSVVALTPVLGYDIAFKVVTAAPMVFMPVAGWLMGRVARAPFPVPAVLALGTLPFIFGNEYEIYGGNILSTLAGEFAFAWSLWFALVFFGLVMRGLQTGRYRAWAAVAFACCFMSHIDPAMFAVIGLVVLAFTYAVRSNDWKGAFWWSFPTLLVGGLLAAWWALAFYARLFEGYVTDMGYQRITTFITTLFPASDTWLFILGGMGAVLSVARRRRVGEFLFILALLSALAFRYMPQSILWNARVLPFWFLSLYLLAALAIAEMYAIVAERTTTFMVTQRAALLPAPLVVLVLALLWVGFPLRVLPGEHATANGNYAFLGIPQKTESVIPSWITWNYSGYQAGCPGNTWKTSPASCDKSRWPEYEQIVQQLEKMSKVYGCGNVMWEYNSTMNSYGTPDALTILPYWTNGCIGSMEGLYYEASATTPFHFIDQSELSLQPSDPMVGLTYASSPDVALGVEHLQMLGVKYYMAINKELQTQAAADPSLKLIDKFGPFDVSYGSSNSGGPTGNVEQYWDLYLVLGSPRVHPLADQPVVMEGLRNTSQPKWLGVMQNWYDDPSAWDVYLAAEGPKDWARVPYGDTNPPVKPEPPAQVSDVVEHNASISFNVSRTGVPIVVTISYFPNWQVSGAEGVYRVSPNLMVVVPTSHHVEMWYGTTPVDYGGYLLSLVALLGLVYLGRRPLAMIASVRRPALGQRGPGGPASRGLLGTVQPPPSPAPGANGYFGNGGPESTSSWPVGEGPGPTEAPARHAGVPPAWYAETPPPPPGHAEAPPRHALRGPGPTLEDSTPSEPHEEQRLGVPEPPPAGQAEAPGPPPTREPDK